MICVGPLGPELLVLRRRIQLSESAVVSVLLVTVLFFQRLFFSSTFLCAATSFFELIYYVFSNVIKLSFRSFLLLFLVYVK